MLEPPWQGATAAGKRSAETGSVKPCRGTAARGPLPGGGLKEETLALSPDVAAVGLAEMHRQDQRFAVGGLIEQGQPGGARQVGTDAVAGFTSGRTICNGLCRMSPQNTASSPRERTRKATCPGLCPAAGSTCRHPAISCPGTIISARPSLTTGITLSKNASPNTSTTPGSLLRPASQKTKSSLGM